jgi:hypothetical protein
MLRTGELYNDPGPDYFTRLQPAKTRARAIGQPEAMGFTVANDTLTARPDTPAPQKEAVPDKPARDRFTTPLTGEPYILADEALDPGLEFFPELHPL